MEQNGLYHAEQAGQGVLSTNQPDVAGLTLIAGIQICRSKRGSGDFACQIQK